MPKSAFDGLFVLERLGQVEEFTLHQVQRGVVKRYLTVCDLFAVPNYFSWIFPGTENILLCRVIIFLFFSRVKKVKSLMFLEFSFHAHQTRLNIGFLLERLRWSASVLNQERNVWNNRRCGFNKVGAAVLSLRLHPKRKHSRPGQGRME